MTELTEHVREISSPYKFSGRRATILWAATLDSRQDEDTGDVEFGIWVARFGKHLVSTDSNGFVYYKQFETEDLAMIRFNEIADEYSDWNDDVLPMGDEGV